jgi:ADP-glucose pyrophosphorylase
VKESIILTDSRIEAGATLERAVIDKNCVIQRDAHVGRIVAGDERKGVVMVGKKTVLPAGIEVGRGCIIGSDLLPDDFKNRIVPEFTEVSSPPDRDY